MGEPEGRGVCGGLLVPMAFQAKYPIGILTPDLSNQPFAEKMRDGSARNRLDLLDLKDAQVEEPTVKSK
jgi:hypothetical protein